MLDLPRAFVRGVASHYGLEPGRSVTNAQRAMAYPLDVRLETAEVVLERYPNPGGLVPLDLVAGVVLARRRPG